MNLEPCTVDELPGMNFDESIHPRAFFDRALEVSVDNWADLDRLVVAWLVREGHLTIDRLPVKNYAGRNKYYINSQPRHAVPGMDGDWHKVGTLFVDTKYNAQAHINNILSALRQLGVSDPHFYLAFRKEG
jgi:hypothetical protein